MKLFTQSYELNNERKTETYIHQCRRILNKQKLSEEAAKTNKQETPEETPNPANASNQTIEQDKECQDILDRKDYYEILGITKNADENEIKKAYKKVN